MKLTCSDVMPYVFNRYCGSFNAIAVFIFHNALYTPMDLRGNNMKLTHNFAIFSSATVLTLGVHMVVGKNVK